MQKELRNVGKNWIYEKKKWIMISSDKIKTCPNIGISWKLGVISQNGFITLKGGGKNNKIANLFQFFVLMVY